MVRPEDIKLHAPSTQLRLKFQLLLGTGITICVPTINVLGKNIENIKFYQMKFSIFIAEKFS